MIMIYFNLILFDFILLFVFYLSGANENLIKPIVCRLLGLSTTTKNLKLGPLGGCETCTLFWGNMIYFLVLGKFTLPNIAFGCLLSYLSAALETILIIIKESLIQLLNWIYNKI